MPFSENVGMSSPPQISCVGNNLVIAIPTTGELLVYDLEGNLKIKIRLNGVPIMFR